MTVVIILLIVFVLLFAFLYGRALLDELGDLPIDVGMVDEDFE